MVAAKVATLSRELELRNRARAGTRDRGAALVEFALLMPLLIIIILGIVEFGWKFGQFNDVRHAAREGARFAAVDAGGTGDENQIVTVVCNALDLVGAGISTVTIELNNDVDGDGDSDIGDQASIRVQASVASLSGLNLISVFLPTQLTSDIQFRLEQPATWSSALGASAKTCP